MKLILKDDNDNEIACIEWVEYINEKIKGVFIHNLQVKEHYQRHKIGTYFLKFIKKFYKNKNFDKIELSTPKNNKQAIEFYKCNDFNDDKINFSLWL